MLRIFPSSTRLSALMGIFLTYRQIFTSGIFDECIMKWKVSTENELWDIDYLEYNIESVLLLM